MKMLPLMLLSGCLFNGRFLEPDPPIYDDFLVHFLKLGSGDATLIEVDDQVIVIDGQYSRNHLSDYLDQHLGDRPIDLAILSHFHPDHWRGLRPVLEDREIAEFWDSGLFPEGWKGRQSKGYVEIREDLERRGTLVRGLGEREPAFELNQPFVWDANDRVTFTIFAATNRPTARDENKGGDIINNSSIVMRVQIDEWRFLFTGDIIGRTDDDELIDIEADLVASDFDLNAQVLKAPHHGSQSSGHPDFIDRVFVGGDGEPAFDKSYVVMMGWSLDLGAPPTGSGAERYEAMKPNFKLLSNDHERQHIYCTSRAEVLRCDFAEDW